MYKINKYIKKEKKTDYLKRSFISQYHLSHAREKSDLNLNKNGYIMQCNLQYLWL